MNNERYAVRKRARERAGDNRRWQFSVFCLLCTVTRITFLKSDTPRQHIKVYTAKQSIHLFQLLSNWSSHSKSNRILDICGDVACTRVTWAFLLLFTFAPTISKPKRNNKTVSFVLVCFKLKQKKNGCSSWSLQRMGMPSARWLRRSVNNKCWFLKRFFFSSSREKYLLRVSNWGEHSIYDRSEIMMDSSRCHYYHLPAHQTHFIWLQ